MAILVTRPKADAEATANRLRRLGLDTVLSPVIEIVPLHVDWPDAPPDALIATSAYALSCALPESWVGLPLFAVGERSASAYAGPVIIGGGNGRDLLELIRASQLRRFVYLAGRARKHTIEAGFEAGQLRIIETYDAQAATSLTPEAESALEQGRIRAVLHYSKRSCEIFLKRAQERALALPPRHLCLSPDVAEPLKMIGLHPEIAATPHEKALLALI